MPEKRNWKRLAGYDLVKAAFLMAAADPEIGYIQDVKWRELPFYQSGRLIQPAHTEVSFVYDGNELVRLSGSSDDIHRANAMAGLTVNADNAMEYMSFFAEHICPIPGNPFYIVRPGDEVLDPDGKPIDVEYPVSVPAFSPTTHFMRASMVHCGALFQATLFCDHAGRVTMMDDQHISLVQYKPADRGGPNP